MQDRAGDVDPTELAGGRLAGQDGAAHITDPLCHHAGVIGDVVAKRHRGMGVGPAGDVVEFFDTDRHAAERLVDIGVGCGSFCLLTGEMAKGVEVAGVDGSVGRRKFLTRRTPPTTKLFDQGAGVALPR